MKASRGATLIELLVTIGIFTLVIVMVSGIFSRFVLSQRRDIAERALQEDLRLALEVFVREARTGYASTYALANDGTIGTLGEMIVFRNQDGTCVAYKLSQALWQRASTETSGPCESARYQSFVPLTSQATTIRRLRFMLPAGIANLNQLTRQGFITVIVEGSSETTSVPPLQLQATVTSRQVLPFTNNL